MQSGEVIAGRYEIIDLIGSGGMGAVYSARHTLSQREVALKVIHPGISDRPRAVTRFEREASAASKVGHPGLVQVLDAGQDPGSGALFLVMELLRGETLKQWIGRHQSPSSYAQARGFLELFAELLEPLDALHAAGFVHRDLKPENVFITALPKGAGRVKVLDFGLTREVHADSETRTGTALGTPHYMAPEQSLSAKDATPAADVWALGVMLYEGLAGTRPFVGETPNAVLVAACTTPYPAIQDTCPWLPKPLVDLLDACLSKRPDLRLQNAGAVLGGLRHALAQGTGAAPAALQRAPARVATEPSPPGPNPHGNIATLSTLRSSSDGGPGVPQLLALDNTLLADTLEDAAPTSDGRTADPSRHREPVQRRWRWVAAAPVGVVALALGWLAFPRGSRSEPETAPAASVTAAISAVAPAPERGEPQGADADEI
ncbi:MAG: serine/threonine protein kinase, partial [Myxococcales bacterium]|nr:serine/threonine protein kinase [Myxococcales bacterium]